MVERWYARHYYFAGYLIAIGGVFAMTLLLGMIPILLRINNISTLYLLVVLILASIYGRGPAVVASVLAVLLFDWFFITPVHTFNVGNPSEWIELLIFLSAALITGQLAATVRTRAEEAQRRALENQILYELSRGISSAVRPDKILPLIAERVVDVFNVEACTIYLRNDAGTLLAAASSNQHLAPAGRPVQAFAVQALQLNTVIRHDELGLHSGEALWETKAGILYLPLIAGELGVGVIAITGAAQRPLLQPGQQHLLIAFSNQVALAIERIRLERESQRAELLARTDELRSALLNSVSHDLRTPLSAILTSATSLLQPDIEWDAAIRHEFLTTIRDEAERLNRLVGNLLDMSRIEAGALHPEKDWYNILEVIDAVLERYQGLDERRQFTLQAPDDLPLAHFDYIEIGQVLANLLENAIKYTPVDAPVVIRVWVEGGEIRVSIHDHGPGIAEQEQARIFDKFYRAQNQAPGAGGTGLGLAIARGLIEAHGGRIWLESKAGAGSTFTFSLPLSALPARGPIPVNKEAA